MHATGLNKVLLIGSLADEPRRSRTPSGKERLKLRLHTVHGYRDSAGVERQSQAWHDVVVWGARGVSLEARLRRGAMVVVEGRLHGYRVPGDPPKWRSEVIARDVVVLELPPPGAVAAAA